jgi:hypothetical protein
LLWMAQIVCLTTDATFCLALSVIYCTDLFHPHDDPDDHFDIACLYAIWQIDFGYGAALA